MKLSKKAAVATSFILGVVILTTSAFADMVIGSGYEGLKSAAKNTFTALNGDMKNSYGGNYTLDAEFNIKDGETVIMKETIVEKFESGKNEYNSASYRIYGDDILESYHYIDDTMTISKYRNQPYRVYLYKEGRNNVNTDSFDDEDFFERDEVKSAEKVLDAFVGNLSSLINAEVKDDGKVLYTGSIDGAQIPTYANALASFVMKYAVLDEVGRGRDNPLPKIEGDVYMTGAVGKAVQNDEGLITSLSLEGYFKATDVNKTEHDYTVALYFNVYNLGATTIEIPDYKSEEYEVIEEKYEEATATEDANIYEVLLDSDVGEYYRVILADDNSGKVIGSKTFKILSVDTENGVAECEYDVVYNDSETAEEKNVHYSFEAKFGDYEYYYLANFEYTDENGNTRYGLIDRQDNTSFMIYMGNNKEGKITTTEGGTTFFRIK